MLVICLCLCVTYSNELVEKSKNDNNRKLLYCFCVLLIRLLSLLWHLKMHNKTINIQMKKIFLMLFRSQMHREQCIRMEPNETKHSSFLFFLNKLKFISFLIVGDCTRLLWKCVQQRSFFSGISWICDFLWNSSFLWLVL